jgi:hypothetical protein
MRPARPGEARYLQLWFIAVSLSSSACSEACWPCRSPICDLTAARRVSASRARSSRPRGERLLRLALQLGGRLLQLVDLKLHAPAAGRHVRHPAAHLLQQLQLPLVGVVQHLPGILGPVQRPVRLGPEQHHEAAHETHPIHVPSTGRRPRHDRTPGGQRGGRPRTKHVHRRTRRLAAPAATPSPWSTRSPGPEPFGLVMTEARAAVTSWRSASARYLRSSTIAVPDALGRNEDEMITAVAHVDQMDCRQCPAAAERRFSRSPLAASYGRLCLAILERPGQLTPACGTR